VQLDVPLVHGSGAHLFFDNDISVPKALRHITQPELKMVRNV
jgi:hypothetical protein